MKFRLITTALILAGMGSNTVAAPFVGMDPRSVGMAGTGVSASTSQTASLYNPALLAAANEKEDFSIEITGNLAAEDPNGMINSVTDFESGNYYQGFEAATTPFSSNTSSINTYVPGTGGAAGYTAFVTDFNTAATNLTTAQNNLYTGLDTLSGRALGTTGGANLVIASPSKTYGFAFMAGGWVAGGAIAEVTDNDKGILTAITSPLTTPLPVDLADLTTQATAASQTPAQFLAARITSVANAVPNTNNNVQFTTNVQVGGIVAQEFGLSLAREYVVSGQDIAFGITPKYVSATTTHIKYAGNQVDNADASTSGGGQTESAISLDFGMAKDFQNGWKSGFSIKNLIPMEFSAPDGTTFSVNPAARIGGSHHSRWATLAADLDLTENDAIVYGGKSRYLSMGAELDLWLLQLRTGYRANLANSATNTVSVGLGLDAMLLHLDLAVASNPELLDKALAGNVEPKDFNALEASLRLGVNW